MAIHNPGFIKALAQRDILSPEEVSRLRTVWEDADADAPESSDGLQPTDHGVADRVARVDDSRVLRHVLARGLLGARAAGEMWANGFGVSWVNLKDTLFQPQVVARLPRRFASEHSVVLVYQMGDCVTAAFADPSDDETRRRTEELARCRISPVCAYPRDIQDAIDINYSSLDSLKELNEKIDLSHLIAQGEEQISDHELEKLVGEKAAIELLRTLLLVAVKEGASDVHIEPFKEFVLVRFRIDGVLSERVRITKDVYAMLIARIKLLCKLDLSERRCSQDGAMSIEVFRKSVDFRVSTLPMIDGEKMVIRVLEQVEGKGIPDLDKLDMAAPVYNAMKWAIQSPNGIVILTGPTGSGKTTTLFSALKSIDRSRINVTTIEDPVEFRLPMTNQLQVNQGFGLDFAAALRSILQQDPDVVLVGELRDLDTARIATQAALTGHLVLTTLYSNDAVRAVSRLVDMGIEPYMVGPAVNAIVAQRLVRRICDDCREPYRLRESEIDRLFKRDNNDVYFYRGRGCPACRQTGYKGRIAIHEMLVISEEIRELIGCRASVQEIRRAAHQTGYRPLRYDGLKKVLRGLTTIDELDRVAMATE